MYGAYQQIMRFLLVIVVDKPCLADYNQPSNAGGTSLSASIGAKIIPKTGIDFANYSEKQWLSGY
jgi:hypothetical protein